MVQGCNGSKPAARKVGAGRKWERSETSVRSDSMSAVRDALAAAGEVCLSLGRLCSSTQRSWYSTWECACVGGAGPVGSVDFMNTSAHGSAHGSLIIEVGRPRVQCDGRLESQMVMHRLWRYGTLKSLGNTREVPHHYASMGSDRCGLRLDGAWRETPLATLPQ